MFIRLIRVWKDSCNISIRFYYTYFAGQGKKQIFTEFNATVKYNEEIQKLLDDHISVLEIGMGEKGLYGRSIVKK